MSDLDLRLRRVYPATQSADALGITVGALKKKAGTYERRRDTRVYWSTADRTGKKVPASVQPELPFHGTVYCADYIDRLVDAEGLASVEERHAIWLMAPSAADDAPATLPVPVGSAAADGESGASELVARLASLEQFAESAQREATEERIGRLTTIAQHAEEQMALLRSDRDRIARERDAALARVEELGQVVASMASRPA